MHKRTTSGNSDCDSETTEIDFEQQSTTQINTNSYPIQSNSITHPTIPTTNNSIHNPIHNEQTSNSNSNGQIDDDFSSSPWSIVTPRRSKRTKSIRISDAPIITGLEAENTIEQECTYTPTTSPTLSATSNQSNPTPTLINPTISTRSSSSITFNRTTQSSKLNKNKKINKQNENPTINQIIPIPSINNLIDIYESCPLCPTISTHQPRSFYLNALITHFNKHHLNKITQTIKIKYNLTQCDICSHVCKTSKLSMHMKKHVTDSQITIASEITTASTPTIRRSTSTPLSNTIIPRTITPSRTRSSASTVRRRRSDCNRTTALAPPIRSLSSSFINATTNIQSNNNTNISPSYSSIVQRNTNTIATQNSIRDRQLIHPGLASTSIPNTSFDFENEETKQREEKEQDTCTICLELIEHTQSNPNSILITKCRHVFHTDCIHTYFNSTDSKCPICRICCIGTKYTFENILQIVIHKQQHNSEYENELNSDAINLLQQNDMDMDIETQRLIEQMLLEDDDAPSHPNEPIVPQLNTNTDLSSGTHSNAVDNFMSSIPLPSSNVAAAVVVPIAAISPPVASNVSINIPITLPSHLPSKFIKQSNTWRKLPKGCQPNFVALCTTLLKKATDAANNDDTKQRDEAFMNFLMIPTTNLLKMRGGQSGARQLNSDLAKQRDINISNTQSQRTFLSSNSSSNTNSTNTINNNNNVNTDPNLSSTTTTTTIVNELDATQPATTIATALVHDENIDSDHDIDNNIDDEKSDDVRRVRKAILLVKDNYMSKAAKSLINSNRIPIDTTTIIQLQALHPSPTANAHPSLPELNSLHREQTPECIISIDDLKALPHFFVDNGSDPSIDGWTGSLVNTLIKHGNEQTLTGLALLFTLISNGSIKGALRELLLTGILVPLPKKDGGVRPLAIGNIFVRLVGKMILRKLEQDGAFEKLFPQIQFGIGKSGGAEIALHKIQTLLEINPNHVVISTDIRNAFNCISRSTIFKQLLLNTEHTSDTSIFRFFHWSHSTSSSLLVYGHDQNSTKSVLTLQAVLKSLIGVRQGDSLSGFFFALGVQQLYTQLQLLCPNVKLVAIHDDLSIIGEPEHALNAIDIFNRLLLERGDLVLQPLKCKILVPSKSNSIAAMNMTIDDIKNKCTQLELPLPIVSGSLSLLGSVIGDDEFACKQLIMNKVKSQEQLFFSVQHRRMPVQVAFHLLRSCFLPRMGYLLRVTKPELIRDAALLFDEMILDTFINKCNLPLPLSPNQLCQIRLPCKLGGLGFTSAVDTSIVAFYASFSLACNNLPELPSSSSLFQSIDKCHESLFDNGVCANASRIPRQLNAAMKLYRTEMDSAKRLQHHLTVQINRDVQKQLLDRMTSQYIGNTNQDLPHRAIILSATAPGASLIFTTLPTSSDYQLSDDEFDVAIRLRLNIVPRNDMLNVRGQLMKVECRICDSTSRRIFTSVNDICAHPHACSKLKRTMNTHRHNMVLLTVARLFREVGHVTEIEPFAYDIRDIRKRPDATCISTRANVKPIMVDVSIVHPACTSHVKCGQKPLGNAIKREVAKIQKYKSQAENENMQFIPLVMESTSAFGRPFARLLRELSIQAADERIMSEREFLHYARASISFALHRGNGRLVKSFASSAHIVPVQVDVDPAPNSGA